MTSKLSHIIFTDYAEAHNLPKKNHPRSKEYEVSHCHYCGFYPLRVKKTLLTPDCKMCALSVFSDEKNMERLKLEMLFYSVLKRIGKYSKDIGFWVFTTKEGLEAHIELTKKIFEETKKRIEEKKSMMLTGGNDTEN